MTGIVPQTTVKATSPPHADRRVALWSIVAFWASLLTEPAVFFYLRLGVLYLALSYAAKVGQPSATPRPTRQRHTPQLRGFLRQFPGFG